MLAPFRRDGFAVLARDPALWPWTRDVDAGRVPSRLLEHRDRSAVSSTLRVAERGGRRYVVKRIRQHFRLEALALRLARANYAFTLFHAIDAAWERGERFACRIHLAAERWRGRREGWETFLVMDFVEGPTLAEVPDCTDALKAEARRVTEALHAHGLASDPHPGNYILSPEGVRAIDVNGRKVSWLRRGRAQLLYETTFGASWEPHGAAYHVARFLRGLRRARRGAARALGLRR